MGLPLKFNHLRWLISLVHLHIQKISTTGGSGASTLPTLHATFIANFPASVALFLALLSTALAFILPVIPTLVAVASFPMTVSTSCLDHVLLGSAGFTTIHSLLREINSGEKGWEKR